jgi:AbiV family abortive infection protein
MEDVTKLIEKSIGISSENLIGFKDSYEFDIVLCHLRDMFRSSKLLLDNGFFSQSLFLTITVLEEIAKTEVCIFRGFGSTEEKKRSKDPLFNHKSKHMISANPILLIGDRLKNSLGSERLDYLFKELESGNFLDIREKCLYFERNKETIVIPTETIDPILSMEMILIVIEMFDDKFVGITPPADEISIELKYMYIDIEKKITTYNTCS